MNVEIVKYGEWNTLSGLIILEANTWKRRGNMKGHHLRYEN